MQMAVTMGEQFKVKLDISPYLRCNPLDKENKHYELNYYVIQFLTCHGSFRKYLHRFGHDTSPICPNYVDEEEDAEHILTCCPRFRWPGETGLGPSRLMKELLNFRVIWSQYSQRMSEVKLELRRLEERRRNMNNHHKAFKLTSPPRCNNLRQSRGERVVEVCRGWA